MRRNHEPHSQYRTRPHGTQARTAMSRRGSRWAGLAGAVSVLCALAACGGGSDSGSSGDSGDSGGGSIKVWIQEDLPDRVAATQKIVDAFTKQSGVKVDLVAVAEDQFDQLLTSSAAAGDLPDVIGAISLPQVRTLSSNDLSDTDALAEVMSDLDEST